MKIKIDIRHSEVMGLVEGLSSIIGQHVAGDRYDFKALWASGSDAPKLDISYREAVTTLEMALRKKVAVTRPHQDVMAAQQDHTLELELHIFWDRELRGLLDNKVNEFVAHSVFAGWLGTFPGIEMTQTYVSMAEADLNEILLILEQRAFNRFERKRREDTADGEVSGTVAAYVRTADSDRTDTGIQTVAERKEDAEDAEDAEETVSERTADTDNGDIEEQTADERTADTDNRDIEEQTADERTADTDNRDIEEQTAGERHDSKDSDNAEEQEVSARERDDRDNTCVHHHRDSFDLSGEDMRCLMHGRRRYEHTIFKL